MPVSRANVVQNPGVLATHLVRPAPLPVTASQPLACTVTAWIGRLPDLNSSAYPPPTAIGHWATACGSAGSAQITIARRRAVAGSRTVIPGISLRSGLLWPSWLSDGVRTIRTRVTAAGSAHNSAPALTALAAEPWTASLART